jgi:hypothetical protein
MSLLKRFYDIYCKISQCPIVVNNNITIESLKEFQDLINESQPEINNIEENAFRSLTKSIYFMNPIGFIKYISVSRNRVGYLVMWTESKHIIRYFGLQGRVHLSWNKETQKYIASKHVQQTTDLNLDNSDSYRGSGSGRGRGGSYRGRGGSYRGRGRGDSYSYRGRGDSYSGGSYRGGSYRGRGDIRYNKIEHSFQHDESKTLVDDNPFSQLGNNEHISESDSIKSHPALSELLLEPLPSISSHNIVGSWADSVDEITN